MKNQWILLLALLLTMSLAIIGCGEEEAEGDEAENGEEVTEENGEEEEEEISEEEQEEIVATEYDNGRYRGVFGDRGDDQVSIQFHIEDGVLTDLSYRHLYHSGNDYREMEEGDPLYGVVEQHDQILEHLEGQPVEAIFELYEPANFVDDIDGFTGATIRGTKILSAMVDGLNRGLYTPSDDDYSRELADYPNGVYRGIFADRGDQQVSIQFTVEDGNFSNLSYRQLYHSGNDYREMEEGDELYGIVEQHDQILDHLEGQPLTTLFDLYEPGDFIDDVDAYTGATVRANKVLSAIRDGLNRGVYNPTNGITLMLEEDYEDGRYRGIYGDRGDQQVSIQFYLEDGELYDLSYRHLYHSGNDYRELEEGDDLYGVYEQHIQILEYLEGKPLETIIDLHTPGDFVEDVDVATGATIRANKVFSAIVDGLNRGIY